MFLLPVETTIESLSSILVRGTRTSCRITQKFLEALVRRQFLNFHTIDNHLRNIYVKLRVQSRTSAVSKAIKERLL